MALPWLLCAPLALSEADLGVESEGLQSLLAKRREVEEEVSQLVGMAPLKAFLAELNAKVTYVERGGDPRLLEGCLNVVLTGEPWDASRLGGRSQRRRRALFESLGTRPSLTRSPTALHRALPLCTGNPGAGKTTAARLLFRPRPPSRPTHFPSGPSVPLRKDVFVERNALELKGTHVVWTCPHSKEMVQAAFWAARSSSTKGLRLSGAARAPWPRLIGGTGAAAARSASDISDAHLSGISQDGDRGDSFSDEALRTLLTETENNRNSLCVVLAGYRDGPT